MKTNFKKGNLISIKTKTWAEIQNSDIGIVLETYNSGLWIAYLKVLVENNVKRILVSEQSKFLVEVIDNHV